MRRRVIRALGVLGIVVMLSGAGAMTAFAQHAASGVSNDEPYLGKWIYSSSLPYTDSMDVAAATVSTFDTNNTCDSSDPGNTVWYRYRATSTLNLTLDTFGSSYDTEITVFNQNGQFIDCNDDADEVDGNPVDPNNDLTSYLNVRLQAGRTYLIRVGSYDNPAYCQVNDCTGVSDSSLVFHVNEAVNNPV